MLIPFKLHICYFEVLRISVMDRNNIKDGKQKLHHFVKLFVVLPCHLLSLWQFGRNYFCNKEESIAVKSGMV